MRSWGSPELDSANNVKVVALLSPKCGYQDDISVKSTSRGVNETLTLQYLRSGSYSCRVKTDVQSQP